MKQKTFLQAAGVIFSLIAVLHLLRLVFQWPAEIAGWAVPMWFSVVALLVAVYLGMTAFRMK